MPIGVNQKIAFRAVLGTCILCIMFTQIFRAPVRRERLAFIYQATSNVDKEVVPAVKNQTLPFKPQTETRTQTVEHISIHTSISTQILTATVTATVAPATFTPSTHVTSPSPSSSSSGYHNLTAADFQLTQHIVLAIKTGATEAALKIPPHLITTLTHSTPNHMFFSDLQQSISEYTLYDTFRDFNATLAASLSDFDHYRALASYGGDSFRDSKSTPVKGDAWKLDKYKNLHMAAMTYEKFPYAKWFVYIDADTYVLWHNLELLLATLKPEVPLYAGSVAMFNDTRFAHGGSGYVVSAGAMEETFGGKDGDKLATDYEAQTAKSCCGDHMFAVAMLERGNMPVSDLRPVMNGDPPNGLYFESKRMCKAVVTLHHMHPAEMWMVWEWERRAARSGKPLLHGDLFEEFVWPYLRSVRTGWDNWAKGRKEGGVRSATGCSQRCRNWDECKQWKWREGECTLGDTVRLGVRDVSEGKAQWWSGWMMDRVAVEVRKAGANCQESQWWPKVGA